MPDDRELAVEVRGIGKRFWKMDQAQMLLRSVLPFARVSRSELWALRHIDFEVTRGETVGILGRNGSGKSTLLQLLCGVSRPSEGELTVRGRIAPLLSVGVGFNQDLSGRENVLMNGLLLGLTEDEIAERLESIVAFSELADFIDTPVKFYSSGMFVRLGFAVAVHAEPDVLLVDEVLSVGDVAYQVRCAERMAELQERGTTIVLVSHSLGVVHALCPRALVLDHGSLVHDGDVEDAIGAYQEILSAAPSVDVDEALRSGSNRRTVGGAEIVDRELLAAGERVRFVRAGSTLEFRARIRFDRAVEGPLFGINILGENGKAVYGVHSPVSMEHESYRAGEVAELVVHFDAHLGMGSYRIATAVSSNDGREVYAADMTGVSLYVDAPGNAYGFADLGGLVVVDGRELVDDRSWRLGDAPAG